jgi:nitrogen fixation NifU-like protein
MTEAVKGRRLEEVEALFGRFHALVTGDPTAPPEDAGLGKLAVFAGVREYPVRVKCATLPWHTVRAALRGDTAPVKTE